jgi:hypothetical protein
MKQMARMFFMGAFAIPLSACPFVAAQSTAPAGSRWAVRVQTAEVINQPGKSECHPLQYFSENWKQFNYGSGQLGPYPTNVRDKAQSQRVGAINGFAIYDVIHEITGGENFEESPYLPTVIKMILVERKPDEFCEIFNEEDFQANSPSSGLVSVEPSYLVDVASETVLATHDQVHGTCGCYNEAYWSFDKDGPVLLDLRVVYDTAQKLLAPGASTRKGWGFDIQKLTYGPQPWEKNDGSYDGNIYIQFALKDHQLVVSSQTVDADPATIAPATYGKPPTRITVDGAVEAQRLIKQVPPVLPPFVQRVRGLKQGTLVFHAFIGKDGVVGDLVLSRESTASPLLVVPTMDAVHQWRYAPTIVDGNPVEVETTITVTYP